MRVALVAPSLGEAEGQGRVNRELIRCLSAAGIEVDVYTGRVEEHAGADDVAGLPGVRVRRMPRPSRWQLANQLAMLVASTIALAFRRYDLVHVDGAVTLARADVAVAHLVHAAWRRVPRSLRREPGLVGVYLRVSTALNVWLERIAYRRARLVCANSEATARDLVRLVGVDPARILVLPLGVDAAFYRPPAPEERDRARRALGLRDGEFAALIVGAVSPRKGVPAAIEAVAGLEGVRLVIVGDQRGSPLVVATRDRGLPVTFLPRRPDVRDCYWAADALVHPALYEPFGLVVLEAMACGLPVAVAAGAGAAPLVDGAGVLIADPAQPGAIRAAIQTLRTIDRREAGRAARRIAEGRPWTETAAGLIRSYEQTAGRSAVRTSA